MKSLVHKVNLKFEVYVIPPFNEKTYVLTDETPSTFHQEDAQNDNNQTEVTIEEGHVQLN